MVDPQDLLRMMLEDLVDLVVEVERIDLHLVVLELVIHILELDHKFLLQMDGVMMVVVDHQVILPVVAVVLVKAVEHHQVVGLKTLVVMVFVFLLLSGILEKQLDILDQQEPLDGLLVVEERLDGQVILLEEVEVLQVDPHMLVLVLVALNLQLDLMVVMQK